MRPGGDDGSEAELRVTRRRAPLWALAAAAIAAVALAVGFATAPEEAVPSAATVAVSPGPNLPRLGKVAPLPDLHEEVVAAEPEVGSTVTEAPSVEEEAYEPPVESTEPAPPVEPSPSDGGGGGDLVPET